MPKEVFDKDYPYLPHSSLLTFEEITRMARLFVAHGVRKIRLTGGEPLLRKNIEVLIEQLAALRTVDGQPLDITLTTNGSLLARKAQALKDAGLQRVTVSLDGLDDAVFRSMNDVDFPVADVLDGIEAARDGGLAQPIKINMVVKRGTNDHEICPWRGTSGAPAWCCASSNTWTWAPPTAGAWTRCCPRPRWSNASTPNCRWCSWTPSRPGRNRRALGLCRRRGRTTWRRRDRRHQQRDAGVLPATATAPACPPRASSTCACLPARATTCAR